MNEQTPPVTNAADTETLDPAVQEQYDALSQGVDNIYAPQELKKKLALGRPLRIKLGLDPTAPDIHLGHTVQLRKLRQFQDLGHKAVVVIGDYTAKIGDPTGRDSTRPILDDATIAKNAQTYLDQAGKVLDLSEDKLEVRRNSEWLAQLSFADVLRLTGQVTVQQMLHRDNFKKRIADEAEIMISEFMYPLMQAYDSVMLEADVELGGSDQTFNNLMGRQLMEKRGMEKQVVFVLPLLVGTDGTEKMSKSKGNYVGVADKPSDMYGKVMSIPDTLMQNYFELLTSLPRDRVTSLLNPNDTHPRNAKDVLARTIVEMYHDAKSASHASDEFKRIFSEKQSGVPDDMPEHALPSPIGLLKLITTVGFASSNGEARRLVQQNAVSLDGEKLTDPQAEIELTGEQVLKVGKRRFCKVKPG